MPLAVVIFLRLRSVLGRRTGSERPPFDPYQRRDGSAPDAKGGDNVITLPPRAADAPPTAEEAEAAAERIKVLAPAGGSLAEGLKAITAEDRSFNPDTFLKGARSAYEMIVTAFAEGDRKMLKQLLSREVLDGFVAAIVESLRPDAR